MISARIGQRWTITWFVAPALTLLILVGILALLLLDTRPLEVNQRFGYDGLEYARLAERLRSGVPLDVEAPYVFRLVTPALVALSGLELHLGFFVLNVAADLGAGLLLLTLLRQYGASPGASVVAVTWWGILPFALRKELHTPVLVDAVSFFILVALLLAARPNRYLAFSGLLVFGVLARESLLVLAPLLFLRALPLGWRMTGRAVAATLPALVVLALIHLAPLIPPSPGSAQTTGYVALHVYLIATNTDSEAVRALLGPVLGLGGLLSLAFARLRAAQRLITVEPGWLYLVVATSVAATVGGRDHDRNFLELAPFFLLVGFVRSSLWTAPVTVAALTLLQVIASRALVYLAGNEPAHLNFSLATMPAGELLRASILPITATVAVGLLAWYRERRGDGDERTGTPQRPDVA